MVTVKKFKVENYKSVKDSGDCYLANGITVLAGRNESGKTSILEALEDFDTNRKIRKEAIPIHNSSLKPKITVTFEVEKTELEDIYSEFVVDKKKLEIIIEKNDENEYSIINSEELFFKTIKSNDKRITEFKKEVLFLKKILDKYSIAITLELLDSENLEQVSTQVSALKQNIEPHITKLSDDETIKKDEHIAKLKEIINELIDTDTLEDEFLTGFKKYIPNFILFDTYNDQIPNKVPLAQLKEDDFIKDLVAISDLDIDLIQKPDNVTDNLKHKDKVNITVSDEYKKFWEQDAANLFLNWDKDHLQFWIKEKGDYYEPKQRSKGRQWHLAFYVRVTARSKEEVPNIILIDEPGLFLHARAQKDILRKLEESSKDIPIIFSTHSPYLIDPNNLNRVRLVEKTSEKGTKISKIHAKADKETLTPILTAIGEDLAQGIRVDIKNSFIVEGISDYYYLHAFKKLFDYKEEMNIVPGCGDNIPAIASILFGWGLDPYFILDSDKPKLVNSLKKKLDISESVIIKILDKTGTIEEIFSEDDLKNLILDNGEADLSKGIIRYIKDNNVSKELLARTFLEKVNAGEIKKDNLSDTAKTNIEAIFEKISKLLSETNGSEE